jgi:pimeloyl-ACP methyl ester carboxylesterase
VLAEDLASHGYVVVGSDSPYTTPGVASDNRIALRTAASHPPETARANSELAPGRRQHLPVVDAWVKDNRFIVDRLEQLDERDPSGRFAGLLDLGAVGAVGHSIGGAAALQFCHEDPRCRAGVDLDGAPLGDVVIGGIAKPFLFLFTDRPFLDAPERRSCPTSARFSRPSIACARDSEPAEPADAARRRALQFLRSSAVERAHARANVRRGRYRPDRSSASSRGDAALRASVLRHASQRFARLAARRFKRGVLGDRLQMNDPGTNPTHRRRFAGALVRHAARVMPREEQRWAEAMQNEMAYVTDDGEACRWAIGCVRAAHAARLRALSCRCRGGARWRALLAVLAFVRCFNSADGAKLGRSVPRNGSEA